MMATIFMAAPSFQYKLVNGARRYRRYYGRTDLAQYKRVSFPRQLSKLAWHRCWDMSNAEHKSLVLEARQIIGQRRNKSWHSAKLEDKKLHFRQTLGTIRQRRQHESRVATLLAR